MDRRIIAEQIFLAAVDSVIPDRLIAKTVILDGNILRVGHLNIPLEAIENIYVIGAGKACAMMAAEIEKLLGSRITGGHIVTKYGYSCNLESIKVTEAGHPVPDSNGFRATKSILEIADKAGLNDLVLCLLSGGGSSLLCDYPEGISPDDLILVNTLLVNSGASISEINAVRKHLSNVKGGQLARSVYPATLISLILSDVPGDLPDVIASGPTTPDPTTFVDAIEVIDKFSIRELLPERILNFLYDGATGKKPETPKKGAEIFKKATNIIIGTNKIALEIAKQKALEFNINAVIIDDELQGDAVTISEYLVDTALKYKSDPEEIKPVCILFGGETTVKTTGTGEGGRNQHLALLCSLLLQDHHGITILSAGTDGTDGPTDAAGAVVDSDTVPYALSKRVDPAKYLADFNSYNFFKKTEGHIITGPTMTNVMDIVVILVWQK